MESSTVAWSRDTAWAMSGENVEALKRSYEAVNRGDVDGLLVAIHPDEEFTSLIA